MPEVMAKEVKVAGRMVVPRLGDRYNPFEFCTHRASFRYCRQPNRFCSKGEHDAKHDRGVFGVAFPVGAWVFGEERQPG
jgi:hypothetical protein